MAGERWREEAERVHRARAVAEPGEGQAELVMAPADGGCGHLSSVSLSLSHSGGIRAQHTAKALVGEGDGREIILGEGLIVT